VLSYVGICTHIKNPEHYYLGNYTQHLEFILNPDYESLKSILASYVGHYGNISFYIEENSFYFTDYDGLTYELLPLSENKFMVPSIYELQIHIVKENGLTSGLKYIYRDGREEFFSKTTEENFEYRIN
jgi:hypothetical protein